MIHRRRSDRGSEKRNGYKYKGKGDIRTLNREVQAMCEPRTTWKDISEEGETEK